MWLTRVFFFFFYSGMIGSCARFGLNIRNFYVKHMGDESMSPEAISKSQGPMMWASAPCSGFWKLMLVRPLRTVHLDNHLHHDGTHHVHHRRLPAPHSGSCVSERTRLGVVGVVTHRANHWLRILAQLFAEPHRRDFASLEVGSGRTFAQRQRYETHQRH